MHQVRRTISWVANTCRHSNADVYLGLAPGLDVQSLCNHFGADVFVNYPGRPVSITDRSASSAQIPLELFALRDASLCKVIRDGRRSDIPGFDCVKLVFDVGATGSWHTERCGPQPAVVAFLLTIGLSLDDERVFFGDVVTDFLDHSWSSLPKLLREIGCADPSAAA